MIPEGPEYEKNIRTISLYEEKFYQLHVFFHSVLLVVIDICPTQIICSGGKVFTKSMAQETKKPTPLAKTTNDTTR